MIFAILLCSAAASVALGQRDTLSTNHLQLLPAIVPLRRGVLVEAPQPPQPYNFGYESVDLVGTKQHRNEFSDATGAVKGSYGFTDPHGMYRRVEYTADADGYRATVHSNEPGMTSKNVADAAYFIEAPPPAVVAQGLAYLKPQLKA
ncbi:cuticle protein 10.9-like [Argiope bruennichi]|uniref:Cuticle protein 16.8 like protein n=1 Tax=Argiope bruennichi TaxID=94029 RepID=A0A8T0EDG1_ARGBR|nr:cuticle protein 10.9-like [Argiope bruennichi]KAF8770901.1 Cuticle protein 16.8 like protein [Argiope bruennichi]